MTPSHPTCDKKKDVCLSALNVQFCKHMASRVYLLVLLINLCFAAKKDEKVDFWLSLKFFLIIHFLISRTFLHQV